MRKRRELRPIVDYTGQIQGDDILVFTSQRNERIRLPYFLDYYRSMGANHFVFVDNDSTDGSLDYLTDQPDVSVWRIDKSYKCARFGVDYLNALHMTYVHGHLVLTVNLDEFPVYPFCNTRPLQALTDWLDASSIKSFRAMLWICIQKVRLMRSPIAKDRNRWTSPTGLTAAIKR